MEKPYSINVVDGILVVRFSQAPTVSDVISAMDEVIAKCIALPRLWIFQFGIRFSTDELKKLAQYAIRKSQEAPPRTAIVAPDDYSFGLARMHDVFRQQEGLEMRVFRGEQEAIAWLNYEQD